MPFHRVFCLAAFATALACAAHANPPATTYEGWIAKAEAGDPSVDYTALRRAYAVSPGYSPYDFQGRTLFTDAFAALNANDCATATAKAKQSLAVDYVNFALHALLSECLGRAGDHVGAKREYNIRQGLIDSLFGSGDGKSVATAYVVVTMAEERAVLAVKDVHEEMQALITSNGRQYDQITGRDKDGVEQTLFFDVSAPFGSLDRTFNKGKSK